MHYFPGVKLFWSARNKQPVIDVIKKFNSRNKALSIATYDLPILYTNIAQNKLKNVVRKLINISFEGGEEIFIAATKFCQIWANNKSNFKVTFNKTFLKMAVNFFLDNYIFFQF